jgi:hypothetical protein
VAEATASPSGSIARSKAPAFTFSPAPTNTTITTPEIGA